LTYSNFHVTIHAMKTAYLNPRRFVAAMSANIAMIPIMQDAANGENMKGSVAAMIGATLITGHEFMREPGEAPTVTRRRAAIVAGAMALGINFVNSAVEIKTGAGFLPTGIENFNPDNAYVSLGSAGIAATGAALAFSERESAPAPEAVTHPLENQTS
jgi:hypothetical protein